MVLRSPSLLSPTGDGGDLGYFVVTDYGAVGNDSNTNTTAIQAAIDAAEAEPDGGVVYFPPGVYRTGSVRVGSNTTLMGASRTASVIKPLASLADDAVVITNKNVSLTGPERLDRNIWVKHLGFDGSLRVWPTWLSTSTGEPVTNPQADYVIGTGFLASGITAPTLTASVSGGTVTGVAVGSGGAGYNGAGYIPNTVPLKFTGGGGTGAAGYGTIAAGALTSCTVTTGGRSYTSPPSVTTLGGYRDIKTLYEPAHANGFSNRRNVGHDTTGSCIFFTKMANGGVIDCEFRDYTNIVITDAGCLSLKIEHNHFERTGKNDSAFPTVWVQSSGNPAAPPVWYQDSEDSQVNYNTFKDLGRLAATFTPTKGGVCKGNFVENAGESGFFVPQHGCKNGGRILFEGNTVKGVRITDITANVFELNAGAKNVVVRDNYAEESDAGALTVAGVNNVLSEGNIWKNIFGENVTIPYGPFSERATYNHGARPLAGTARSIEAEGYYYSIGSTGTATGEGTTIRNDIIIDARTTRPPIFRSTKAGASSVGLGPVIENVQYPPGMLLLEDSTTTVWAPGRGPFIERRRSHFDDAGLVLPDYASSPNYLLTPYIATTPTAFALVANTLYLSKVDVLQRHLFTTMKFVVTVASAGAARIGIYECMDSGAAGALLVEPTAAAPIDVGSTGLKAAFYNLQLEAGAYYLALNCTSTPTVVALSTGNARGSSFGPTAVAPLRGDAIPLPYASFGSLVAVAPAPTGGAVPLMGIG